jgi:hypothetical protein
MIRKHKNTTTTIPTALKCFIASKIILVFDMLNNHQKVKVIDRKQRGLENCNHHKIV